MTVFHDVAEQGGCVYDHAVVGGQKGDTGLDDENSPNALLRAICRANV
jgi:hypothetical protein